MGSVNSSLRASEICSNVRSLLRFSVRLSLTEEDEAQQLQPSQKQVEITKKGGKCVNNCRKSGKNTGEL